MRKVVKYKRAPKIEVHHVHVVLQRPHVKIVKIKPISLKKLKPVRRPILGVVRGKNG